MYSVEFFSETALLRTTYDTPKHRRKSGLGPDLGELQSALLIYLFRLDLPFQYI